MRSILTLWLMVLCTPLWARTELEADILVQSRFNKEWSSLFLDHLRSIMVRQGLGDPYERTIEEPLVIDLGPRVSGLTTQSEDWYLALLKFLKIDLVKSDFKLVIDKLHYQVDNLDADIAPNTRNSQMIWTMSHNVAGLGLNADRIALEVSLHSTTGRPIVFKIELLGAELGFDNLTLPVTAVWNSNLAEAGLAVALEKVDLREAMVGLQKNSDKVVLNIQDIVIPPVQLRIGDRTISIEPTKLRNWILNRKDELKKFILDVIVKKNLRAFEDLTGEEDPTINLPKEFFAPNELMSGALKIESVLATQTHMRTRLSGVFCLPSMATDVKSCEATAPRNPRAERLGRDYEASLRKIFQDLESHDANIIVSLGEPFLNQAITTAISAGLLTEAFGDGEVSLATGGALLQMDKSGEIFYGYLHLNNKLSGWDRRLTGRSSITFPIKLGLRLRLENKEGEPQLVVDVVEAEATSELLLNGKPEHGMASNIATVPRFRGKVIQKVQESVKKFQGQRMVELPLPFLKGTFLEKTQFISDGFGRANALFKVEERRRLP